MVRQRGANNVVIRGRTSYFGITCQAYAAAGEQKSGRTASSNARSSQGTLPKWRRI